MIPIWIPIVAVVTAGAGGIAYYYSEKKKAEPDGGNGGGGGGGNGAQPDPWPPLEGKIGKVKYKARKSVGGGYTVSVAPTFLAAWIPIGEGWDTEEVVPRTTAWLKERRMV